MSKSRWNQKLCSVLLSGILAVSSIGTIPPMELHAAGTLYATRSFDSSYDSQYAYYGDDLGCSYTPESTTFKVWSPEATAVVLCRYEQGAGGNVIGELPMEKGSKGVWSVTVDGDIVNTYYTYKVTVNGTTKEAVDIYAKAAGVNGDRAMVVDLDSTDPANWDTDYQREKTPLSDIIVWEVHIRDFSIDASSGVSEGNRGKYKAFTEDTTVNGEGKIPSCVNYLKELGVTHVQLLPMYDYASVDETTVSTELGSNYNWGYDPKNYNVPEGSYSSNPYDGNVRITEMKEMIQALHDAGIKVIMDVVYNHTYSTEDSNFNKIMPDYYYKLKSDLSYSNQSGCGNATRSESAMYRKFMIDSVSYWAGEYNLDGFRFDLMGIHDVTTMNQLRQTLDEKYGEGTIVLYGEGWTAEDYDANSAHKANEALLDDGIGYFNDQIRDAIKGEHKFDGTIGLVQTNYVSGSYLEEGEKWPNNVFGGIMGSVGHTGGAYGMWRPFWSKSSNCCISYTSAHDNLTLWDKLTEGYGKDFSSTRQELLNMNKMAGSVLLTSKGGVFMQAGEEFARTKNGDDNSYQSPDSVNKIDWTRVGTYSAIRKYYQGMIQIRKAFSGFRSITTRSGDNWAPNNNNLTWIGGEAGRKPDGLFGFYETNNVPGEWNRLAVLINNAVSAQSVTLTGSDKWVIIADGTTAGLEKLSETDAAITVPAKSVMIAVPKDTFDANSNKAPVIDVSDTYDITVGESLTFTAAVSDADGDSVTLAASGLPGGAVFDTASGVFRWENPVAGTYQITVTASDGKDSAVKSITINVTEKTAALEALVADAEGKSYAKADFTEAVWTPYEQALADAKQLIESSVTDDTRLHTALLALRSAYQAVTEEADARETLKSLLTKAQARSSAAENTPDNYETAAADDLKTVIGEAAELLTAVHPAADYTSTAEDLEDALNACTYRKTNSVIRVKAPNWGSPAVYVWMAENDYISAWPGNPLTEKDEEGWYVYDLPKDISTYSLIVNDGTSNGSQTADITDVTGSVDITVTSFSGKSCSYIKAAPPATTADKTRLNSLIAQAEQLLAETESPELSAQYGTAVLVKEDADVSQVTVNQTVRALKESIRAIEDEQEASCTHPADKIELRNAKAASCTEKGYTGDRYCTECGKVIETGTELAMTAHTWDNGTVTKQATATETGLKQYTCLVCHTTKNEVLAASGTQGDSTKTNSGKGSDQTDSGKTGSGQTDSGKTDSEQTDSGKTDSGQTDSGQTDISEAVMQSAVSITTNAKIAKGALIDDPVSKTTYKITGVSKSGKTVEYAFNNSSAVRLRIPNTVTINGTSYKVTSLAANAFKYKEIEEVILGTNIKSIGKRAFYGCRSLKAVTLSNNLTTIGEGAFEKCTVLTRITIPSKVKKIGKQAFYGCKKLSGITIRTTKLTKKKVGSKAFKGIASKATIKVPKKKLKAYKTLLKARGVGAKAKIKK
ncbi:MAG: type I pullulanase [Lachnospiraceae bacterium]|nr:type I pullulanase [Lachnospiraceae bacterium]